jgi:dihydrofolate synthase/folylpolyglutamate synthase
MRLKKGFALCVRDDCGAHGPLAGDGHGTEGVVCDTGHNADGVRLGVEQLATERFRKLHVVWGMCADKDVRVFYAYYPLMRCITLRSASVKRALLLGVDDAGCVVGLQGSC